MNKLTTRLALSITLVGGMLLSATQATAQQEVSMQELQLAQTSSLRAVKPLVNDKANLLVNLKTTQYKAKDINGKEHDIDAILKSGKLILFDFSTVWCTWCWKLHNSGTLEKLYAKFGPEGTNQIEVFWVEVQGASKNRIQASGKDWTKDSKGNPVPYSIISDARLHLTLGIDVIEYPTLVLIGKNKWIRVYSEIVTDDPEFPEFVDLFNLFIDESDKTDVEAPTLSLETTLYPNPASDYVTVQTRVGSTIELFAADGTMLSTTQATGERTTIALAQLPAGRYIARITSLEGEVVYRPLIIE